MSTIKGLSEKNRNLLFELVKEIKAEGYAEGFEAGKSAVESVEEKTPNQQRAELIEKAKKFVESKKDVFGRVAVVDPGSWSPWSCVPHFYKKGNRVTCVLRGYETNKNYATGRANCMPSDVFNLYIGQAISLARALQIDLPVEFLKAVQPSEAVIGTIVEQHNVKGQFREVSQKYIKGKTCGLGSDSASYGKIIEDTNAQYEVTK